MKKFGLVALLVVVVLAACSSAVEPGASDSRDFDQSGAAYITGLIQEVELIEYRYVIRLRAISVEPPLPDVVAGTTIAVYVRDDRVSVMQMLDEVTFLCTESPNGVINCTLPSSVLATP